MRNTIPSKCVLLQIIIYSCAIVLTLLCGKRQIASLSCLDKTVNDLDYRQISLLSVSCRSIICLILRLRQILIQFTDKSRYFAQTCKAIKKYFLAIVYALNKSVNIAWAMFSFPPWSVCYCSHKRKSVTNYLYHVPDYVRDCHFSGNESWKIRNVQFSNSRVLPHALFCHRSGPFVPTECYYVFFYLNVKSRIFSIAVGVFSPVIPLYIHPTWNCSR